MRKNVWYIVLLIIGAALVLSGSFNYIDEFWSGMGCSLIAVSLLRLILFVRYKKDPEYAKRVDISNEDERVGFVAVKAQSWTLSVSVWILCLLGILLRVIGYAAEAQICFYIVCGMLVIYLICHVVASKRF